MIPVSIYTDKTVGKQTLDLCVMIPYFNPAGYTGAIRRYLSCTESLQRQRVPYYTVEVALKDREFELEASTNILQLRSADCLWHKEAALNALLQHIPPHYTFIAWIDRDVLLLNDDWPHQTTKALERYRAVQLFEHMQDLGPNGEVMQENNAAMAAYAKGIDLVDVRYPGGAWAMQRSLLERYGLFDLALVGGGDMLFLQACIGFLDMHRLWPAYFNEQIREHFLYWSKTMHHAVRGVVGNISGTAQHLWKEKRTDRYYQKRHILIADLEITRDLCRNADDLWEWTSSANRQMREAVTRYFFCRAEGVPTITPALFKREK